MEIYAVQSKKQLNHELFSYLLQYLEEPKIIKIKKFIKWEDAQRALLAELLIRYLISSKLKINNRSISFSTNQYKKPFLTRCKEFQFNLSHSGEWIVCAVDQYAVGIDVERVRTINLKIANRFFNRDESEDLFLKKEPERTDYFFTLWTLKESYMKAVGMGLYLPLSSFSIKYNGRDKINIFSEGKRVNNFHLKMFKLDDNYKLSVCASHNRFPRSIHILQLKTLITYFKKHCHD